MSPAGRWWRRGLAALLVVAAGVILAGCSAAGASAPRSAPASDSDLTTTKYEKYYIPQVRGPQVLDQYTDAQLIAFAKAICAGIRNHDGSVADFFAADTPSKTTVDQLLYLSATGAYCRSYVDDAEAYDRANPAPVDPAPVTPTPTSEAAITVTYAVTGNGSRASTVTFNDPSGSGASIAQDTQASLPWTKTYTLRQADLAGLYTLSAQDDNGSSITCTITVDGKVIDTHTATGPYAIASCS